jgi:hypothetical protein
MAATSVAGASYLIAEVTYLGLKFLVPFIFIFWN